MRKAALCEFLVHGLRYAFPAERSGVTRGVPTSYAAPPLKAHFGHGELPPVWPHPEGTARGEGLAPLYKSAPSAALRDARLYGWLALVDAVRAGRARERKLATPGDRAEVEQVKAPPELWIVARSFGDILPEVVFVGGMIRELLITDPAAGPARATLDVECIVNTSYADYARLSERLRAQGFAECTSAAGSFRASRST